MLLLLLFLAPVATGNPLTLAPTPAPDPTTKAAEQQVPGPNYMLTVLVECFTGGVALILLLAAVCVFKNKKSIREKTPVDVHEGHDGTSAGQGTTSGSVTAKQKPGSGVGGRKRGPSVLKRASKLLLPPDNVSTRPAMGWARLAPAQRFQSNYSRA